MKHRTQDIVSFLGYEAELGLIKKAEIDNERCLTFWLHFEFNGGGSGQGFGGIALDTYDKLSDERIGHAAGTDALLRIMQAMGVEKWSDLAGKLAWALRDDTRTIVGIARPAALVTSGSRNDGIWLVDSWRKRWAPQDGTR